MMTTVAQLNYYTNTGSPIQSRDLKLTMPKTLRSNVKEGSVIKKTFVFCAVVFVHILILIIALKLSTRLPKPPIPDQTMMVSLFKDAPTAPIIKQASDLSKPQRQEQNHQEQKIVQKPQTQPTVNPQAQQLALQTVQAPATQVVSNEAKKAQENTPSAQPEIAEAKASDSTQKAAKEAEIKADFKEDVVEPPRFGVAYLNNPKPNYPNLSRRAGEQGRVLFKVLVGVNGEPESVEIAKTSGFDRLDQAGLEAVKQWRFVPAKKNNQPTSAYVIVPVSFSLDR